MTKIKFIEVDEFAKCPYCGKDLNIIETINKGFLPPHIIYRCPYCKKLLSIGVAH